MEMLLGFVLISQIFGTYVAAPTKQSSDENYIVNAENSVNEGYEELDKLREIVAQCKNYYKRQAVLRAKRQAGQYIPAEYANAGGNVPICDAPSFNYLVKTEQYMNNQKLKPEPRRIVNAIDDVMTHGNKPVAVRHVKKIPVSDNRHGRVRRIEGRPKKESFSDKLVAKSIDKNTGKEDVVQIKDGQGIIEEKDTVYKKKFSDPAVTNKKGRAVLSLSTPVKQPDLVIYDSPKGDKGGQHLGENKNYDYIVYDYEAPRVLQDNEPDSYGGRDVPMAELQGPVPGPVGGPPQALADPQGIPDPAFMHDAVQFTSTQRPAPYGGLQASYGARNAGSYLRKLNPYARFGGKRSIRSGGTAPNTFEQTPRHVRTGARS